MHFGCHNSPCIFKTKASRGPNLGSYFNFYSLNKIGKEQLYRISGFEFYEWLFGPKKFSGLSRNGPQDRKAEHFKALTKGYHKSALADLVSSACHNLKWDHFDFLAKGRPDIHSKIRDTTIIREFNLMLNEYVSSE